MCTGTARYWSWLAYTPWWTAWLQKWYHESICLSAPSELCRKAAGQWHLAGTYSNNGVSWWLGRLQGRPHWWYGWDTISNRGVFLQGLVTLWILTKNIFNVLFIYLFFCPPWISSRRKVIWQLSQSPLTWLEKCLIFSVWFELGVLFLFHMQKLWFCAFESLTLKQESNFHPSEQKIFGLFLQSFWWSSFTICVQPGFHLFYICLIIS